MDNQGSKNVFAKILYSVKLIPSKIKSLFNRNNNDEQGYNVNQYPFQQEMGGYQPQDIQNMEPLTMAGVREMLPGLRRRGQQMQMEANDYQVPEQAFNQVEQQAPNMQYAQMPEYPPMQNMRYDNMQSPQMPYDTMQGPQVPYENVQNFQYPVMQNQYMQQANMQENHGYSIERNPLLDVNIAVYVLLKPNDCHEMLRGIINPSLYIINMENMIDEGSVTYCKHVLMGARLVLNYAIKRISSKNIYILCPEQINIKMDEVAQNLISRYEKEPRSYNDNNYNRSFSNADFYSSRQEYNY